jgi:hypothetical protein
VTLPKRKLKVLMSPTSRMKVLSEEAEEAVVVAVEEEDLKLPTNQTDLATRRRENLIRKEKRLKMDKRPTKERKMEEIRKKTKIPTTINTSMDQDPNTKESQSMKTLKFPPLFPKIKERNNLKRQISKRK